MGGYKVINLHNNNLDTTNENGITISGLYETIENSYRKMLVLHNIVIDGVEKADIAIEAISNENSYTIKAYNHTITITNSDNVKIVTE